MQITHLFLFLHSDSIIYAAQTTWSRPRLFFVCLQFLRHRWNLNCVTKSALGQHNDNFVRCPADALTWEARKYLILQEIIQNDPDVICLQVRFIIVFVPREFPCLPETRLIDFSIAGSRSFQISTIDAGHSRLWGHLLSKARFTMSLYHRE